MEQQLGIKKSQKQAIGGVVCVWRGSESGVLYSIYMRTTVKTDLAPRYRHQRITKPTRVNDRGGVLTNLTDSWTDLLCKRHLPRRSKRFDEFILASVGCPELPGMIL